MEKYICKIASLEEIIKKSDYEIKIHPGNDMWKVFKELAIKRFKNKEAIVYIGILNNEIICEATAYISNEAFKGDIQNIEGLLSMDMVYLSGFRTNKEYEGKGYFLKLFNFMEEDLKNKGYKKMCLGVEPSEVRNMQIYFKLGFINYIKTTFEHLPSKDMYSESKEIIVSYYYKNIN